MRCPTIIALALAAIVAMAPARVLTANEPGFKIIVHPNNPVGDIDRERLRNIFLKKVVVWTGGETIRPIDLSPKFSVRDQFTRKVLKKTPAQLKAYWSQQIFSGKGMPPPQAARVQDAIAYVLANRGAIGYVPAHVNHGDAKVIGVD